MDSEVVSGSNTIQPVLPFTKVALHKSRLHDIKAARLIDAGDDLVQTEIVVQPCDPVERRVDRVELFFLSHEVEQGLVPSDAACIRLYDGIGAPRDEALGGFVEIRRVAKRKRLARLFQNCDRVF